MSNLLQQGAEPQEDRTTFIYALVDPITNFVRYVGKANNPKRRHFLHINPSSLRPNTRKNNWIKSLLAVGKKPELIFLEEIKESVWQEAERRWIYYYRNISGYPELTNGTSGGDGAERGHKKTPDTLKKLSISGLGHKVSQETRDKISQSKIGKPRPPEVRKALSDAAIRRWDNASAEERKEISSRIVRPIWTEEMRKRVSEYRRKLPKRPGGTSKFIGVSWDKKDTHWRSYVTVNQKNVWEKSFIDEIEAARARDRKAIEVFGESCSLNFPRDQYENNDYGNCEKNHIQRNNTSGYRGVFWFKKNQNWMVSTSLNGKKIHIGYFKDKIEAAMAYDRWTIQHRDATDFTNFTRDHYPYLSPSTSL
jgi:AP2 domain